MKVTIEITDPSDWQKLTKLLRELNIKVADVIQPPTDHPNDSAISLKRGSGRHLISHMADDFTAPLTDFNEYM